MSSRFPRRPARLAAILACGAALASAQTGPLLFDFENSFSMTSVQTWGAGAVLETRAGNSRLLLTPAAGPGWKGVTLTLPPRDLSGNLGLALIAHNPGAKGVGVHVHVDDTNHDYPWSQGYVWLDPGRTDTVYVHFHRKNPPAYLGTLLRGMRGLPGGFTDHWELIAPARVDQVKVAFWSPTSGLSVAVDDVRGWGSLSLPTEAQLASGYLPLVDTLGQWRHGTWPGKAASARDLEVQAAVEAADLSANPGPKDWDAYGGWAAGPRLEATGRFRAEKVDGKWWLVTPEGRLFWSHGINAVGTWEVTPTGGRERLFASIPPDGNFRAANLRRKLGPDWSAKANAQAHARLRSWGMNTLGNWSDRAVYRQKKTPYTVNYASVVQPGLPGVLDTAAVRAEARKALAALKKDFPQVVDDPWCLGVFSDNELGWPSPESAAGAVAEDYFRINSQEVRAALPGVLYLGSRIHVAPAPVWRAAAKYCDVVAMNRYEYAFGDIGMPADVDEPLMLTEYHFGALDRGLPHPSLRAALNQRQRADLYADMVAQCLLHPKVVGAHWFQFADQPYTGRSDGENYQVGFVDVADRPYPEMVAMARRLGNDLYRARSEGTRPGSFSSTPSLGLGGSVPPALRVGAVDALGRDATRRLPAAPATGIPSPVLLFPGN